MNKFTLMMIGVAPLCCSDLCAYSYNMLAANVPVKAVRSLTGQAGKATKASTGSSGCSCSGGRAASSFNRSFDRDEDDKQNLPPAYPQYQYSPY